MRALLYSDWCTIRGTILRLMGVALLISAPIMFGSVGDVEQSPAVAMAAIVMSFGVFYTMIGLFGADESGDWEQVRLALPTTPREVVRERYAFLALTAFAAMVVGVVFGMCVQGLFSLGARLMVPRDLGLVVGAAVGITLAVIAYLALLLPAIFALGMSKARMLVSLPFFLKMLLALEPVRDVLTGTERFFTGLAARLGSPAPIFVGFGLAAVALYLLSMRASERIYAAREL